MRSLQLITTPTTNTVSLDADLAISSIAPLSLSPDAALNLLSYSIELQKVSILSIFPLSDEPPDGSVIPPHLTPLGPILAVLFPPPGDPRIDHLLSVVFTAPSCWLSRPHTPDFFSLLDRSSLHAPCRSLEEHRSVSHASRASPPNRSRDISLREASP